MLDFSVAQDSILVGNTGLPVYQHRKLGCKLVYSEFDIVKPQFSDTRQMPPHYHSRLALLHGGTTGTRAAHIRGAAYPAQSSACACRGS